MCEVNLKTTETLRLRLPEMVKHLENNRLFCQRHHNHSIAVNKRNINYHFICCITN